MNKEALVTIIKGAQKTMIKHSPEILTALGIAGMWFAGVDAVKETRKALMLLADAEYEKGEELTVVEKVKVAGKVYIRPAVTACVSTACLIGATTTNVKRNAALATAYSITQSAFKEYKEKVVEEIGEKKEKHVREKIAQDKIDANPSAKTEVIVIGDGETTFCDPISMRYFKSTINAVDKAINTLNYRMTMSMEPYISLSELYDEIGLPHTKNSDRIGWNLFRDGQIEVEKLAAKDDRGLPCLMLDYNVLPRWEFDILSQ